MIKPSDSIVLYQGQLCPLAGRLPTLGSAAMPFHYLDTDAKAAHMTMDADSLVLGVAFSVDTVISANFIRLLETRMQHATVKVCVVTRDLPFALRRFTEHEKLKKVLLVSAGEAFGEAYGVFIESGRFAHFYTHALFLIKNGKITYLERPQELSAEPDVEALMQKLC